MLNRKQTKEQSVQEVNNIETDLDEITNVEEYIYQIIGNNGFYGLNKTSENTERINYDFISVRKEISEEEFFRIVNSDGKRCRPSAGLYQQSLFGRYLEAKKEEDFGYIHDIFEKAIEFKNNMEKIKKLKKNKAFMREWRNNVGKTSPEFELKNSGSMRKINIIENISM